jgi:adenine-specific DNA-methyltransferase
MEQPQVGASRTLRGIQQQLIPLSASFLLEKPAEPKGVVYTKRWVVDLLLDLAGYRSDVDLGSMVAVEPSAGEGAFLGPMVERLVQSCRRYGHEISDCHNSLIAYELSNSSASHAREVAKGVLTSYGVDHQTAHSLVASWIQTGDYLLEATRTEADFVIGNPPYVRLEDISEHNAAIYRQSYPTMCGRADLYIAFFEAALHQLKKGGVCAFICADRWMRNQYGGELRRFITSAYAVETVIEMHNADAFLNEVDAYPAITIIKRETQGQTVVAAAGPRAENMGPCTLLTLLRATAAGLPATKTEGLAAAVVNTWSKGSDPWPCNSPEQLLLLRRLENHFRPLESVGKRTKVGIGVATGIDSVFITKDPMLVEASRLQKLALAKDIRSGAMEWSGHYLVDPWDSNGLVNLSEFPKLQSYLAQHASLVSKRHTASKNPHAWYRTIDRVSHTLTSTPKLYIADIKNHLDPVLDRGETYPHHNLYFIQSEEWDLEVLGALLMSAVGQFFVESYGVRMRGGYFRFQAQYLRRVRVPNPDSLSQRQSEDLVVAFRERDRTRATRIAFEIYGINPCEMETALGH